MPRLFSRLTAVLASLALVVAFLVVVPAARAEAAAVSTTLVPPSTVSLAVDRTVIQAGESARLTATVDQPLRNSGGLAAGTRTPLGDDIVTSGQASGKAGQAPFGDAITFGGTKQIRRLINYELNGETQDVANSCTAAYTWGSTTGLVAATIATGGGAGAASGGARAVAGVGEAASRDAGEIGESAATVRRFLRQDEFDAVHSALSNGDSEVQIGRYFTPDNISSPSVAAEQLALPGTRANPLVGYVDVPASALPSEPLATFGPRLVKPEFGMPGGGLEIEVSDLYGRPSVPTAGLQLVRF